VEPWCKACAIDAPSRWSLHHLARGAQDGEEAQRAAKMSADTAAKIEAAASKCKKEQQSMQSEADRLNKIRARRRTKDLEQEAMDLLNGTLESVFKAADSNGDGTLDRDEVEAAFKKSDALQISDESLLPILDDILDKNGGRASFEQFKEIAWKASVKSAVPSQSPLRAPPPEVQDRASHFVRSDSGNWKA